MSEYKSVTCGGGECVLYACEHGLKVCMCLDKDMQVRERSNVDNLNKDLQCL